MKRHFELVERYEVVSPNLLLRCTHGTIDANAPKYSVGSHFVCQLKDLSGTSAALVPQFASRQIKRCLAKILAFFA